MTPPPTGLILRPMTLDDLPQVYRIELDSFTLPWPFNSYVFELTESQVSRCFVATVMDSNDRKKILGMIVLYLIEDEAHVATFAIHKENRQAGIGWRLLHYSLKEALREGAKYAFLEVRAGNQPAISLYSKFGFKTVSIRKKYYADNNEDALLMNLEEITLEKLNAIEARFVASSSENSSGGTYDA
ncbi:MAG TPA: ribosomal protein S18-alanine N-acetyltransferase [Leptolinea sp.]